jgi:hypothetical protein
MTDNIVDSVKGNVAFLLGGIRTGLLSNSSSMTPEQLVDQAIASTLDVVEQQFELRDPTQEHLPVVTELAKCYWDMVNDDGEDPVDLRKAFNENSTGT